MYTVRRLNIPADSVEPPFDVFPHNEGPAWYSVDSPLTVDKPPGNIRENVGEYVRIELFPYLTRAEPIDAIGFAFQLGMNLGKRFPTISRMTLVLGSQISKTTHPQTGLPVFRIWLGFAFSDPTLKT